MFPSPQYPFGGAAPTRPELIALLRQLMTSLSPEPVPLDAWRDRVLALYRSKARTTRLKMGQATREAIALAGPGATTADLTPELVAAFAARPGHGSTTNGLLRSLHAAMRLAVRWGQLDPAAVAGGPLQVPEGPPARRKHFSRSEVARVLDHLRRGCASWEGHRLYAFASILAFAGLRRTEALILRVGDVDLDRGFVFVSPNGRRLKTPGSEAPVPMPGRLRTVLRYWIPRCGSEWLLPGKRRGGPWTGGPLGKRAGDRLRLAAEEVGVEGMTPHTLRHSLSTHLGVWWGLSRTQRKLILRHTTERTGDRYLHPDLEGLAELVRDFDYQATPPRTARAS
jgi:integrase